MLHADAAFVAVFAELMAKLDFPPFAESGAAASWLVLQNAECGQWHGNGGARQAAALQW